MKQLNVSEKTARMLVLKARMRKETGIDPIRINADIIALQRTAQQALENMHNHLLQAGVWKPDSSLSELAWPCSSFKSAHETALASLRENMTSFLLAQYRQRYLPNLTIEPKPFKEEMCRKAGQGGFDAEIIEDKFQELMVQGCDMTLKQLRNSARTLLPYEAALDGILRGKRLKLLAFLDTMDLSTGGVARVSEEDQRSLSALDKLSQVVLRNADPVNVESDICGRIPKGYTLRLDLLRTIPAPGTIKAVRFHMNGVLDVAYETANQARRVAQVLLSGRAE